MANVIQATAVDSMVVGGVTFTDLQNLLMLSGYGQGTGALNSTLKLSTAAAGYQVPVGKTLYIRAVRVQLIDTAAVLSATASFGMGLSYADNDVGNASNTAFTNQVYMGGSLLQAGVGSKLQVAEPGMVKWEGAVNWQIPATKYPGFTQICAAGTAVLHAFGYVK